MAVNSKATVWGRVPKPFEHHILTQCALDTRHETIGFSICPAGFSFYVGLVSVYFFMLLFWNRNVYPVPSYTGNI